MNWDTAALWLGRLIGVVLAVLIVAVLLGAGALIVKLILTGLFG